MRFAKDELRRQMRSRRLALPAGEAAELAQRASRHLLGLEEVKTAQTVALFSSVRGEIDTRPLVAPLRARGIALCYPRVDRDAHDLHFHLLADEASLAPGQLGIPEPPADLPEVAPAAIDLFVVPGLAFDLAGHRLGWGRGYYDRTLAAAPQALRVGLAYHFQIVPAVPVLPGDERVDLLVTEQGARDVAAGEGQRRRHR